MRYEHSFAVRAPLADVAAFHCHADSLVAITPPLARVRLHRADVVQTEGSEVEFTMWLGPLPVRWHARIESVSLTGFVDRQLAGPFRTWTHRHEFAVVDEATTRVVDRVNATLQRHLVWAPVGLLAWLGLPMLFAYRARRTRQLLER